MPRTADRMSDAEFLALASALEDYKNATARLQAVWEQTEWAGPDPYWLSMSFDDIAAAVAGWDW